jgi:hypothetical protein
MPANKRRTFLDDLFCPKLDFYTWERLRRMLEQRGYRNIERWPAMARLDHEHRLQDYRVDLESLATIFRTDLAGANDGSTGRLVRSALTLVQACNDVVRTFEDDVDFGRMSNADAMARVIGQGHHRVLASRG